MTELPPEIAHYIIMFTVAFWSGWLASRLSRMEWNFLERVHVERERKAWLRQLRSRRE